MADELITNSLGGLVMFWIVLSYLGYLQVKTHLGYPLTKWESTAFRALCLIALVAVIVYYVRTQVL